MAEPGLRVVGGRGRGGGVGAWGLERCHRAYSPEAHLTLLTEVYRELMG